VEYNKRVQTKQDVQELIDLVDIIIPNFIHHNEEPEAVDLLMEVERMDKLVTECNKNNY